MRYSFFVIVALIAVSVVPSSAFAARFCSLPASAPKNSEANCYEDGSFWSTRLLSVGSTITFVNYDKEPLRVSSGSHPAHDELPDFDSPELKEGEWYSYTFTKRGTWTFHNHHKADIGGEVTIVGKIYDTSREKPPRINVFVPKAPKKEALPKNLAKLQAKKNVKQLKNLVKKELSTRLRLIRNELDKKRSWKEMGRGEMTEQAQALFSELEELYTKMNSYSPLLAKEQNGKTLGDLLKKIVDERVVSTAVPRAQLLLEIDATLSHVEHLEDYHVQAERSASSLGSGEEEEAVSAQLNSAKEEIGDIQESLEELRDALSLDQLTDEVLMNARVRFEVAIRGIKKSETQLGSAAQKTPKLYEKQSDEKLLKEIASGDACTEWSGSTSATLTVICYRDDNTNPLSYARKGRKVIFYNASSEPMWIASNPHPTHTELSGFDQGTSVNKGGVYEYTFTKPGKFSYHNHMNPRAAGTVKVSSTDTIELESSNISPFLLGPEARK